MKFKLSLTSKNKVVSRRSSLALVKQLRLTIAISINTMFDQLVQDFRSKEKRSNFRQNFCQFMVFEYFSFLKERVMMRCKVVFVLSYFISKRFALWIIWKQTLNNLRASLRLAIRDTQHFKRVLQNVKNTDFRSLTFDASSSVFLTEKCSCFTQHIPFQSKIDLK